MTTAGYIQLLTTRCAHMLAILALLAGRYLGLGFLDAVMGIVGGAVIARWSYGLCRDAGKQLLDVVPSPALADRLRASIEQNFAGTEVVDLHLWQIGPRARACIVSLAAPTPAPPSAYRAALTAIASLDHVTIEVHPLASAGSSCTRSAHGPVAAASPKKSPASHTVVRGGACGRRSSVISICTDPDTMQNSVSP